MRRWVDEHAQYLADKMFPGAKRAPCDGIVTTFAAVGSTGPGNPNKKPSVGQLPGYGGHGVSAASVMRQENTFLAAQRPVICSSFSG
jgi:hypothetical protein